MPRALHPTVDLEDVRRLNDIKAELVRIHLNIIGHPELWGAMRAANAAVDECCQLATRDIDQDQVAALRAARKKQARR